MAEFLHGEGYMAKGRRFKLFTFSKLLGKCELNRNNKIFRFKSPVTLYIASPVENFIVSLANHILVSSDIYVGKNNLQVQNISFEKETPEGELTVKTLSPIVEYSTLSDA